MAKKLSHDWPKSWDQVLAPFLAPSNDEKLERALGRFALAWGVLERELDLAFPVLFRTDPTLACCIYANLGTKAKLDIIGSAISMLKPLLKDSVEKRANELIAQIRDLSGKARNALAHGQPCTFTFADETVWVLTRLAARNSLDVALHPMTTRHWQAHTSETLRCARQWHNVVNKILAALCKVSSDEIEQICIFEAREIPEAWGKTPGSATKGSSPKSQSRGLARQHQKRRDGTQGGSHGS